MYITFFDFVAGLPHHETNSVGGRRPRLPHLHPGGPPFSWGFSQQIPHQIPPKYQ